MSEYTLKESRELTESRDKAKEYAHHYRLTHKEKHQAYMARYYQEHREREVARSRIWYLTHPDEVKQYWLEHREHKNEMRREWYATHTEEAKKYSQQYWQTHKEETCQRSRRNYQRLKMEVFQHYSASLLKPVCECCGESEPIFLTIDHVNGGGSKHRRELGGSSSRFYAWIRRNGFPKGFGVLCYNCNCSKKNRGREWICPHRRKEA